MSFRPERVFTGSSKNPTEYVRKDIVQEMLQQQRELLLEAKERFLAYQMDVDDYPPQEHRHFMGRIDACLNATGESNDK